MRFYCKNKKNLIHVICGPRQVGKSTAADQIIAKLGGQYHFASADAPQPHHADWIESNWNIARVQAQNSGRKSILVLDEIQKIEGWSEAVKKLWDEDQRKKVEIIVILLGSSSLLLVSGANDSLAGRFLLHRVSHWGWVECKVAFGWSLDEWLFFGGYPGAAELSNNESLWRRYINDSLVETVIARDVIQLYPISKPALLRQLFALSAAYPAQILSYNKMLGQLQDAGNTTTLAKYLEILGQAFLVSGIQLFSRGTVKKRGSSPKFVVWNNALINAPQLTSFQEFQSNMELRGRLVENAVGAHFLKNLSASSYELTYWRENNLEVDYIISSPSKIWAFEVKSGRSQKLSGLNKFKKKYPDSIVYLVGLGGIELEEFFSAAPEKWLI